MIDFGIFQTFRTPPIVWKFSKFMGFFEVTQKHIETNEYVLIHPEMQKKNLDQILLLYCIILYSTVLYSTGYHPPTQK